MQTAARQFLALMLMTSSIAFADENQPAAQTDSSTDPTEYHLRYKFAPGEFLHYETESSSTMTVAAGQFSQVLKESRQTQKHLRVVTVDATGNVVLEPVIDHAIMSAQADDGKPVIYDSESKVLPPKQFSEVAGTIGKASIRVRYDATGKIDEVLPIPGLEGKLSKDESTHAFLVVLPDKPAKIGFSWNDDFEVLVSINRTLSKPITIRRRYTLEEVTDGIAQIDFRTYPMSIVNEPQLQAQLIQRSISGRVKFDIESGKIIEWSSNGTGQVFNAFGPTSAMQASSKSVERYVAKPRPRSELTSPADPSEPGKPQGPAGPPLPATASRES